MSPYDGVAWDFSTELDGARAAASDGPHPPTRPAALPEAVIPNG